MSLIQTMLTEQTEEGESFRQQDLMQQHKSRDVDSLFTILYSLSNPPHPPPSSVLTLPICQLKIGNSLKVFSVMAHQNKVIEHSYGCYEQIQVINWRSLMA